MEPLTALFLATLLFRRMLDYDKDEIKQIRNKLRWADNSHRFNQDPSKRAMRLARYKRHYDKHKEKRRKAALRCYYARLDKDMPGDTTLDQEVIDAKESVRSYYLNREQL